MHNIIWKNSAYLFQTAKYCTGIGLKPYKAVGFMVLYYSRIILQLMKCEKFKVVIPIRTGFVMEKDYEEVIGIMRECEG